jgi:DNA (cytosine-5)-methyltransferase 1
VSLKIISLFSGAGGLDLGLIRAGHQIIWANDSDLDCVQTYRLNIGDHIVHADIAGISPEIIPCADVVVGGFPCQGFSQANLKRSKSDKRNKMYRHFRAIVKAKKPKYFLAENVKGILSLDDGKAMKKIIEDFSNAGYRVKYQLFNLADYGVPQTRQRVIIAGTRNDLPIEKDFEFPPPTHNKDKESVLLPWVTISQALNGIPEPGAEPNLPNHIYSTYKVTLRNFTGHRKTNPNKPSPTILARGDGKGGVCAIPHPNNHRRMSIRESATIQTFPPDFKFIGKMNSCYRQVGNAVPVIFAERLGEQLNKSERSLK